MATSALSKCRETNLKVLEILTNINSGGKKDEDVTEFVTTIQLVQITINSLLKSPKEFGSDKLKLLQDSLDNYELELRQLSESSKLLRFFASNRLRRKLEQMNSSVHKALELLKQSTKEDKPKPIVETRTSQSGSISISSNPLPEALQTNAENSVVGLTQRIGSYGLEDEEDENDLQFMIEDEDGKGYWKLLFGLENFMVDHNTFMEGLRKKAMFDFTADEQKVLLYIIDNSNTGFVNQHKFSELLKGFGPVTEVVRNVRRILSCPWFYSFISGSETETLLKDEPSGTFIIRFSSSQPGSFALGFNYNGNVSKILIKAAKPSGFLVKDQDSEDGRHFNSIFDLVDYYRLYLVKSYVNFLPLESYFEGDMSSSEATEALSGSPIGTFLVRFSSNYPGSYAVSYVPPDSSVPCHGLIERMLDPNTGAFIGFKAPQTDLVFPDVQKVVEYYRDTLTTPLKTITNPASVEAISKIQLWRNERASAISTTYRLVSQIFDLGCELPLSSKQASNQEIEDQVSEMINKLFTVA
eukprot:TRINITY_DN1609_c0_g1_i1.p1 TRINITY_DN1609_c0_g1~~TRINITY_DN1609_c0_g1_i1.p1  ORF type:complete len:526 (-),score=149.64 TRINITY_DN1609_c0_g1_i1:77-1654(-)